MDLRSLHRPLVQALSHKSHISPTVSAIARRHESSYRRTKKRLNVKPAASFLFAKTALQEDHIVFNPPSSAPSVLHTPLKFLPKEDPRRQLFAAGATSTLATTNSRLPPPAQRQKPGYQRHHLSEEDVAEMRRLYTSDPERWTARQLAKKYNCASLFVKACCGVSEEKKAAEQAKLDAVKARWGPKRRLAREDRQRRLEAVMRDE